MKAPYKILVVDDESSSLHTIVELLNDDYRLAVAKSGEGALKLALNGDPPDLILLDIVMEGMDGYEVCRRLKAEASTHHIPVIFLTVKDQEEDETFGLGLGAADYITKPISPAILRARVRTQLAAVNETRMRLAKEKAEAANHAKNEFLAMMSHEIRTPMNAILGMVELMRETPLSDRQRGYLDIQRRAGNALMELITDILDLSVLESGQLHAESEVFRVETLVRAVVALLEGRAEEKALELRVAIDPALPEALGGDRRRIAQILLNLMGNAVKFTHEGWVEIRVAPVAEVAGEVRFTISDSGIGIEPHHLELIFEPFTQADTSMTRRYGGSGLGLSIAQRMAELLGGRLRVESEPGRGSQFHFQLPLSAEDPARCPGEPEKSAAEPGEMRPLRILVAEDSEDNALLLRSFLQSTPHTLDIVENGAEAVGRMRAEHYDLVLMDMQMPIMDGYAATRAIRGWEGEQGRAATPILALTAHAMEGDDQKSLAAGCDAHLTKPIKKAELLRVIGGYAA